MLPDPGNATVYEGYTLVWADEFNGTGYPDPANWGYETGYVRNGEYQEYTTTNALMSGGSLKIIGCKNNDGMKGKYTDSHYTSGSLVSKGLRHFKYGRYEFRAKVPVSGGAWPVLWMMGTKYEWPACGEIDIMEYYSSWMHANWCWGADYGSYSPWTVDGSCNALWDFKIDNFTKGGRGFPGDPDFFSKFHVWRMDWTETNCVIYIDGVKMNEQDLSKTINKEGYGDAANGANPFQMPQYILMNIAMGAGNGGAVDESKLPMVMEVDYVRCYRETSRENDGLQPVGGIDMTPQEGPEYVPDTTGPSAPQGYHLAWNDEFNSGNTPSGSRWLKEAGSTEYVANDVLVMPLTNSNGSITWGGLDSVGPYAFTNGILEVRARLPMARNAKVFIAAQTEGTANPYSYVEILDMGWNGASPFIGGWVSGNWNGEGGDWFDGGFAELLDADEHWAAQFHVWRYVVDDTNVSILLDGKQIYRKSISSMGANPPVGKTAALHHVYFWLTTDDVSLDDPLIGYAYEIDYVRCYEPGAGDPIADDPTEDPPSEVDPTKPDPNDPAEIDGYTLSWHDEFNGDNVAPDTSNWDYEIGMPRNNEAQVYGRNNATCVDGRLVIEVRKESDGRYTSSSLVTKGNRSFLYGKYIFRARIPMAKGTWPCMWMMGRNYTWPSGGEIDIQEAYWQGDTHFLKCNLCWNGQSSMLATEWNSQWYDIASNFLATDEDWGSKYHTWTMDWSPDRITIYVDGRQILDQALDGTLNQGEWGEGTHGKSPFREPQYILLNLPVGGDAGGWIDDAALPQQLEVDYVRCYRKTDRPDDGLQPSETFNTTPGTGPEFVADTTTPTAPNGYELCWNDEFNEGTQPAASRWNVAEGSTLGIANGLLTMTADSNYSWGMIDTKGIRSFTNGIIEVRARIPVAKGVYTTMWTESVISDGSKPYAYAEFLDSRYLAGSLSIATWINWWDGEDWYDRQLTMFTAKDSDWAAKFHVWKYVVDDDDFSILIDNLLYYKRARSTMIHKGQCPFGCADNPQYLALCLKYNDEAILDPSMLPAKLDIDYVRCYIPSEGGGEVDPEDPTLPLPGDGVITVQNFDGAFDGGGNHWISITVNTNEGYTVEYGTSGNGPWTTERPYRVDAGDTEVWYRVTINGCAPVIGSAHIIVRQADNRWTTEPAIAGWTEGETPSTPAGYALFGSETLVITYSGTKTGGESVSGASSVSDAGSYTAHFVVPESANWAGLSKDVNFTIAAQQVDPPTEPVEQPTNATMQAWFAYTAATEQVVGGAWQDETEDGVKVFLPTASSKDGDLVYVDVTAKFPAVAASKLPSSVTAQGALSAADGYLYVFAASGWTKLANATVSADAAKSYRVEFDYGSENAPRLRVWEQGATDYTELKDADGTSWFALTANTFKCFTSLAFSGDGTIGDFVGTSETGPREVVTIEIPSFTDANGDVKGGVALRTVGGKNVFSVTIANGKKGAHYTAFVSNTLSTDLEDWVAAADSTSPDADGLLTLDIIRDDSPAKFAKIVATPTAVKAGTTLDTLAK